MLRQVEHVVERKDDELQLVVTFKLGELLQHDQLAVVLEPVMREAIKDVVDVMHILENEPETGTVRWFDDAKGYGFISDIRRHDVFVHHKGIDGEGYKTLESGQEVSFVRRKAKRSFEAIQVRPLTNDE